MAEDNRFPSPANVKTSKNGQPNPKQAEKPAQAKEVKGEKVAIVEVLNKCDRNIALNMAVHLAPGLNCVNSVVWASAKVHPNIVALLKSGELVEQGQDKPAPPKAKADDADGE